MLMKAVLKNPGKINRHNPLADATHTEKLRLVNNLSAILGSKEYNNEVKILFSVQIFKNY